MQAPVVQLREVAQRFGGRWAFTPLSAAVAAGARVWIRGGNGAGKTTLLRLVAGSLAPSWGTVTVFGAPAHAQAPAARRRLALMSHAHMLYESLSAADNLHTVARLLGRSPQDGARQVAALLARVGLADAAGRPVADFSAGMKRRAALARLLLVAPELLLVDEPFAQLDAAGRQLVHAALTECLAAGATLLFTSHQDEGAGALADEAWELQAPAPAAR